MTGSHRLISCTPEELFEILRACCADQSAAADRSGFRRRLPHRLDRRLLIEACGRFESPHRAQMVSTTRFGQSYWELTCDRGAHGSIAHLQLEPRYGIARWLPRHVQTVYLTALGDRMLQTIGAYAVRHATSRTSTP
jgi:hypothetical protein